MYKIKAPFSPEQVASLKGYQECGYFHPFTCGDCGEDLVSITAGWICPTNGCNYTQDWCHDFMANSSWQSQDISEVIVCISLEKDND